MSTSSNLARSSAKSGFNVLWGMIFSSIISAIGAIIVGNTLSGEEVGLVSIVLSGPTMIGYLRDLGINSAVIKNSTQARTENDHEKLKSIVLVGTSFEIIMGIILTVASFLLSGVMANLVGRPTIVPLIQIASLTILATGLLKTAQCVFIGYEKMALRSVTVLIQAILKNSFMVVLVTLSFGAYGAIIGQIIGYVSTALVSFALMYLIIITKLRKQKSPLHYLSTLKYMLNFGLPLSVANILGGVLTQFYTFLSAIYITDLMMGNYSMALNFANLVSVFAVSVSTVMFPTFSKIKGHDDSKTLQQVFQYSVKYSSLLIVPLSFAVIALSAPGVEALFHNKFEYTPLFLSLYCLSYIFAAVGNLSAGSLINSQGKTKVNMNIAILTFVIGLCLSLVLIPYFGVLGLLVSYVFSGLPGLILSLIWIKKHYDATIDWLSSIKIVCVSAFSAALTYLIITQLNLISWVGLLVGTPIFLGTYVVAAPLVGAINYMDTQNLKDAMKSLGPLAIVIDFLLYPIEKIAKFKQKNKNK